MAEPCPASPPRFPSLPGAETPQQMNGVMLDYFFPPKEPFSPPPDYGLIRRRHR